MDDKPTYEELVRELGEARELLKRWLDHHHHKSNACFSGEIFGATIHYLARTSEGART